MNTSGTVSIERKSPALGVAGTLFDAGYRDLVSVIPPDGELSPTSRIREDQRGKVPGLLGARGWHGYKWDVGASADLPRRIDDSKANIGLRGRNFPALDIDSEDPTLTEVVMKVASEVLRSEEHTSELQSPT